MVVICIPRSVKPQKTKKCTQPASASPWRAASGRTNFSWPKAYTSTARIRSGTRSNSAAGRAARRRLNRPHSWRKKMPIATRMQSVNAIADTIRCPCSPRLRPLQIAGMAALLVLFAACRPSGPAAVVHTSRGDVHIRLELALTPETQERGLMYRSSLPEDQGMLFVFDQDIDHSFWMKNTLIPLDMLFITADGRVAGVHANATPLSTAPISVGRPSRYVLEIGGGGAARRGIASGDR